MRRDHKAQHKKRMKKIAKNAIKPCVCCGSKFPDLCKTWCSLPGLYPNQLVKSST